MERAEHENLSSPLAHQPRGTAAVLLWSILSLIPLLISSFRIHLWTHVSAPAEQFALPLMLVTQLAVTSLLFPWLLAPARSAAMVVFGSALLIQLSGLLGDDTWKSIGQTILWVWMWQGSLWLIAKRLRTIRAQQVGVSIAGTAVIGGMVGIYLRAEFRPGDEVGGTAGIWIFFAMSLGMAVIQHSLRSRQPIHR